MAGSSANASYARSAFYKNVRLTSITVGLAWFGSVELMHRLILPELGRTGERLLAEGISAALIAVLAEKLIVSVHQRQQATLLRLQVISEMNQHVRNALAEICLAGESVRNQQVIATISENVEHIEWALREILLRPKPVQEKPLSPPLTPVRRSRSETAPGGRNVIPL